MFTVLLSIKCPIALHLKNVHTLIKNTLLPKNANHCLSFQQTVIFLLVEGLASVLMAADSTGWWLLKVGVAVAISEK